jgi:beta-lactam-binding protein with PASTA domain
MLISDSPKESDSHKNVNIRMEKRDGETYVALGLFIIAVGIPVIFGTYFAYSPVKSVDIVVSRGATVVLPSLHQMTAKKAKKEIEDLGLTLGETKQAFDAGVPKGLIVSQEPQAGAAAGPDTQVTITLSRGPAYEVRVPRLMRQPVEIAKKMVEHAALTLGTVSEDYSLNIPEGSVMRQEPTAEAVAVSGAEVTLIVSKGPEAIKAPKVLQLGIDEASKIAQDAGLVVGPLVEMYNAEIPAGVVVAQKPAPGGDVNRGAILQLTVSTGVASSTVKTVPNFEQQQEQAASEAIEKTGLRVGVVSKAFDSTVPAGVVIRQNPPTGTYLEPHARAATVNVVCAVVLLVIGFIAIFYGRRLLTRNKGRD